jgi:4-amino-4-deoxychorismate lyase
MTLAVLVNGVVPADPAHAVAVDDRGFQYGDGVFETALLVNGKVRFLEDHLQRLATGCERLGIRAPDRQLLLTEIASVTAGAGQGVLKIIVSRGAGGRGYRAAAAMTATRVVALHPAPQATSNALRLRWCETRLGRNTRLAGIKHLNRLEQVLAQNEWSDGEADEGLMMDTEGELVCATAGNVFAVREGVLVTPDLRFCGVRGIMRGRVLRAATQAGIAASEEPLWPHDVEAATEVFLTNAVRGIRPVAALDDLRWNESPVAARLSAVLKL